MVWLYAFQCRLVSLPGFSSLWRFSAFFKPGSQRIRRLLSQRMLQQAAEYSCIRLSLSNDWAEGPVLRVLRCLSEFSQIFLPIWMQNYELQTISWTIFECGAWSFQGSYCGWESNQSWKCYTECNTQPSRKGICSKGQEQFDVKTFVGFIHDRLPILYLLRRYLYESNDKVVIKARPRSSSV